MIYLLCITFQKTINDLGSVRFVAFRGIFDILGEDYEEKV